MADPVVSLLTSGTSTSATTTVNFTAQSAGTLLILGYSGDDYASTSGSGRPESTGWTKIADLHHNAGHAVWYKISAGSETSVQYTIGSAVGSAHALLTATNIDGTTPLDTSNSQSSFLSAASYGSSSITPASGRKLVVASLSYCRPSGAIITASGWTNSYTEIADQGVSNGATDSIGFAYLVLDGGTSTSTTATFSGTSVGTGGMIASFVNATASSNFTFPFRRNPSRGLIMRGRR